MDARDSRYFNRFCQVTISDEGQKGGFSKTYDGLYTKFKVSRYIDQPMYECKASVLGLPRDIIQTVTSFDYQEAVRKKKRRIRIYGGYTNNKFLVFSGYITYATPTKPPEQWLDIEADNYLQDFDDTKDIQIDGGNRSLHISTVFSEVAKSYGLQSVFSSDIEDVKLTRISLSGTYKQVVEQLAQMMDAYIYNDGDRLLAIPRVKWDARNPVVVNKQTGLIAVTSLTPYGADIVTLMDNRAALNNAVFLESKLIPKSTGLYRVLSMDFVGDFRGKEWYTVLHCMRQGSNRG